MCAEENFVERDYLEDLYIKDKSISTQINNIVAIDNFSN